jgi:CheY-like chemotaxis protein
LIVDDAASTRRFLRGVLEYCPQFDVAGEAENGASAIEMADALQPDVVLLDLSMPVSDGSSALSGLLRVAPNARVIVLSGTDTKAAAPLLAAGATAFVPKGLAPFELLDRLGSILGQPVTMQRVALVPERPADTGTKAERSQFRAMLCDDDAMARHLVSRILTSLEVPVLAETDGVPHLLSAVRLSQPELVVLDLWLEGTPGTSAIPEIRTISPGTIVIVYSAYEEWKDKALAAGATAFVAKPNFGELEAHIRQFTVIHTE